MSVRLLQSGPQIIFVINSSSISGTSISPFATSTGIFYGSGVASTFDSSSHNVYWGINPTSKTSPPPSFLPSPSLNLHTVQAPPPFLGNLNYILVFHNTPHLKIRFFQEPSYLLKVTKFLVKISQFEFLVITEQNILVYKLFFLMKYCRF